MSLSSPFIQRPIATSLLMAAITALGVLAYPFLPVSSLPQVDFPVIVISVGYPGASPETMASAVATPLERQFAQVPGVTQILSTSAPGLSSITVQFELSRDLDGAAQDVLTAINAAGGQLPNDLPSPPTYRKVNPSEPPVLIIAVRSDLLPLTKVSDYADTRIAQQLSQIAGVAEVNITGEQKPAVRIQLDPERLASLGLGLEEARQVIAASTVDRPKGSLEGGRQAFQIRANDQILDAEPWNDVILAYRNGAALRVRDVGPAIEGPENRLIATWQSGQRGVNLIVRKQPGSNAVDIVARVRAALPKLRAAVPPSVDIEITSDRTQTIRASIHDVQITLAITFVLVLLVVWVFLRDLRATLIPSLVVVVFIVSTLAVMQVVGYSLNNLSLMALVIAVGFVVDDAIVVLENIVRYLEEGMSPREAAEAGSAEIGFTVMSISISLVAVFIPLLLMGGVVGRLFQEFAVIVSATVMISAFVSLTLVPAAAAVFLRPHTSQQPGRVSAALERGFKAVEAAYERSLDVALHHSRITLTVFGLAVAASAGLFMVIPKGFFPQQDTGFIFGYAEAAPDVSFASMSGLQQEASRIIEQDPAVLSISFSAGATGGAQTSNTGRYWIDLKPLEERDASADQVIIRLSERLREIGGLDVYLQAAQDINLSSRVARTQYQFVMRTPDAAELNTWTPRMLDALRDLPEIRDVATDQQPGGPTLQLRIDRDTANRFGIQPQLIDDTLASAFGQRQVAQYFTQLTFYRVILEVDPAIQDLDPREALAKIYLRSPTTGGLVPLSVLVSVDPSASSYLSISHLGQFPAATLSFNLAPGMSLGEATQAVERVKQEIRLPDSVETLFQGNAQQYQSALRTIPLLIVAALVTVYVVLGMLYESYVHPLTIISTLPPAGVGALLMLDLFGFELTIIAIIGIILLIGIVKKNGIMLVDFALQAERDGAEPHDAIREACIKRFRPIMMTTVAAVLGGVPLMIGLGTGAELRQPLGFVMVGGLVFSQALTLYTTPVIYLYLDRLRNRSGKARQDKGGKLDPPMAVA